MVITALGILGLLALAASTGAWWQNRLCAVTMLPPRWQPFWRFCWPVGVALAVGSWFLTYPVEGKTDRYRVHGKPFAAYAFDQAGHDYVGAVTMLSFVLNCAVWVLLPQLVFRIASRREQER